jgi:serine/threonine-protein kinase
MIQPSPRRGGLRFGKYVLLDRLAVGGMAEIFLARQEGVEGFSRRRWSSSGSAPPLEAEELASPCSSTRRAWRRSSTTPTSCDPRAGQLDDSYFIAMEYVFGRDMARIIPKAERTGIPFPAVYALKIAAEVCEGLHYAHQRSDAWGNPLHIVHRDVTPENVFVSFDGTVKILDFGIAKARGQSGETSVGEIKGKLSYLSPEQALGKTLDCRSDIFSLGVVLYEWLTGLRLFTGDSEAAVLRSISGKIYGPSYFARHPAGGRGGGDVALEKDRDKRHSSAWEMQRDLEALISESDFRPSSMHLANFLKQLFSDELEAERTRFTRASETLEKDASVPRGSKMLKLRLDDADREALETVAERHGLTLEELARDVLRGWLKYR